MSLCLRHPSASAIALALLLSTGSVDASSSSASANAGTNANSVAGCPDLSAGETATDCPWAGVARLILAPGASPAETILRAEVPKLVSDLTTDAGAKFFKDSWGTSLNFDELAKGMIVDSSILAALYDLAGVTRPTDPDHNDWTGVQHAGIEHTYGYLFSMLKTSFGYKRARWVQGEIERGFGFAAPTFTPVSTRGTLFANVTYFAGRIAFAHDAAERSLLQTDAQRAAGSVTSFDYGQLKPRRVEERVTLADGTAVSLRTDLVPFTHPPADLANADSALLVYSVLRAGDRARLITAFPVTRSFVAGLVAPANLGEQLPITTQYNGYVRGLTGTKILGVRSAD